MLWPSVRIPYTPPHPGMWAGPWLLLTNRIRHKYGMSLQHHVNTRMHILHACLHTHTHTYVAPSCQHSAETLLLALKKQAAMNTAHGEGHADRNRAGPLGADGCSPTTPTTWIRPTPRDLEEDPEPQMQTAASSGFWLQSRKKTLS